MPGRAERRARGAALVCALLTALLPRSPAQEENMLVLESTNEDLLAQFYSPEESEQSADMPLEVYGREDFNTNATFPTVTTETLPANTSFIDFDDDADQLEFILMVLIPLILFALLFLSVIILVTRYRRKRAKQEPYSPGSQSALQTYELGSENIKVPIFEEDTPSVMEIEMEELDKWMNSMNRNADCECLPTLKEEKESNHNPSDSES
ncbi:unnamed protein product [Nyctereutes procyonoides]|uniref:(raccoon dog) hypothetical protein n=1 Tax=Nyctereutes procyonoides TaxID=34880 RepID=A0A811Z134_NYCPR|nr:transmembrane protein 154 isoform X2 [Nyctereutes procyonoides]CAD7681194.1 unnamed protein product [Nyctereutes procyonoides]